MILHLARFYSRAKKKIEFQLVILQENDLPKPLPIGLMMLSSLVQTDYETGNCLSPAHRFRAFPPPPPPRILFSEHCLNESELCLLYKHEVSTTYSVYATQLLGFCPISILCVIDC